MTGQVNVDSYSEGGITVAIELVNEVAVAQPPAGDLHEILQSIVSIDPPSIEQLTPADGPAFRDLAATLHDVVSKVDAGDVDAAADIVNRLLVDHPAHPHLAKDDGEWHLHHHPAESDVLPMWTAICAQALAHVIGTGRSRRLGLCDAPSCHRAYLDESRNASRRFCSTTCQNRVKAAAYRQRQHP